MKILFVAPLQKDANIQNWGAPSLGLMRIDSYLRVNLGNQIETVIYDSQIDDYDLLNEFRGIYVDILGISILHYTLVTTFSFLAKWKKEHSECLIVAGGNEASANYQDIFDKSPCDIIVLTEGEDTMLDICLWRLGKKKLESIPGIVFRHYANPITNSKLWDYWKDVDFSNYRYPEFWSKTAELYDEPPLEKVNTVRLVTTSHCQRACTFCSLALVRNIACSKIVRPAYLEGWQIMDLVHRIKRQLPDCRTIYFVTDDIFYPDKQAFYDFAKLYRRSGYEFRFLMQSSTFSLTERDFAILKDIGCQHITIGIENASAMMRKSLKKVQDETKIENIIMWSRRYGMLVYFLIILIPPESTLADLRINYETIKRWLDAGIQVSIEPLIYVYRGTPLYEDDRYDFSWIRRKIEGTNLYYKDSIYVLPRDPIVRRLALEFKRREFDFVAHAYEKLDHRHHFKGETGRILNDLLGDLLKEYG